ncbi:MAG: hypothetical protein JO153_00770 [Solirubrobacterales bacterium]|nr:hypothetical protein [Solirubrobacterales bacterium]
MHRQLRALRILCALALVSVGVSACGASGGDNAASLLKQTFGEPHSVNSGQLNLNLAMASASPSSQGPVSLSFGGPFQTRGKGQLPASNFSINVSALGRSGSLGIVSTGTSGYVSFAGASYQLPAATFQRLESSFSQITASSGSGGSSGSLSQLGIDPMRWLVNPGVVGDESVAGAQTTHIRAGVNVSALLADLNTVLQKASSIAGTGAGKLPGQISPTTRQKIAGEVKSPSVDVWTGRDDKMLRKLSVSLTLPVSGQVATLIGGAASARIAMNLQYDNLNQPQTITAPTTTRPISELTTKLQSLLAAVQAATTGSASGTGASSTSGASGSAQSGSAQTGANSSAYLKCLQAAGQDVGKLQQCAGLVSRG